MENTMVNVKINGNEYQVPQSLSILDACVRAGVRIPDALLP